MSKEVIQSEPEDWAYCRVSTQDQDLGRQIKAMQDLGIPYKNIVTEKISGTTPMLKRPELFALFDHKLRPGDTLYVLSIDRMSRDLFHFLEILNLLRDMKVKFKALDINIDYDHPIGKFMFNVMGAVSQLQVDFTRHNTKMGLEVAKSKGVVLGRPKGATADMKEFVTYFKSFDDPFEAIKESAIKYDKGEQTIRRWAKNERIEIPRKRSKKRL